MLCKKIVISELVNDHCRRTKNCREYLSYLHDSTLIYLRFVQCALQALKLRL